MLTFEAVDVLSLFNASSDKKARAKVEYYFHSNKNTAPVRWIRVKPRKWRVQSAFTSLLDERDTTNNATMQGRSP